LGRTLGIADQETNWLLLRRLRSAMGTALTEPLRGEVEADETFVGAPEHGGRGRPRSGSRKVTVLVLAETGSARARMRVVPDAKADTLLPVIVALVEPGATITTDGLTSYLGLPAQGFVHRRLPHPPGGMRAGSFHSTPHADGAMSNFKRWVLATYHKPPANLDPYLDEFCFRAEFSGRRDEAFGTLLGLLAANHAIVNRRWSHRGMRSPATRA
jgi:transposase-like protein